MTGESRSWRPSLALAHTARESVHERLQIGRPIDGRDQHHAVLHDDDEVRHTVHHDRRAGGVNDVLTRVDGVDTTLRGVADRIDGADTLQRTPGADVIPAEVSRDHDDAIAALEHAHVDGDGVDRGEETVDVVGVRVQGGGDLRRESSYVVEKVADAPHKDARVPEVSL